MVEVDCGSCEEKGCCRYRGWKVFFLPEERQRVATLYGEAMSNKINVFQARHDGHSVYAVSLPCPFYEASSGHCEIYEARPLICRLFPIELEPITGATYLDQRVCPKWQEAKLNPELVQITAKDWCEKFWDVSRKEKSVNQVPVADQTERET